MANLESQREFPAIRVTMELGVRDEDGKKELMTNEEMQKAMEFIVETDARTAITLDRLSRKVDGIPAAKNRSEKRWKQTETRLHALLAHAKKQEREISAPQRKPRRLRKSAADRRLKALAELVERQISEGRNGKP